MGGFAANTIYGIKMYFSLLFSFKKNKKCGSFLMFFLSLIYTLWNSCLFSEKDAERSNTTFSSSASPKLSWDKVWVGTPPRTGAALNLVELLCGSWLCCRRVSGALFSDRGGWSFACDRGSSSCPKKWPKLSCSAPWRLYFPAFFKPENAQCLPSGISLRLKSSRKTRPRDAV